MKQPSAEDKAFMRNETLLSMLDYRYWAPRYCNPPEAPIWMADLSFRPIGEVRPGDEVVGWENRATEETVLAPWRIKNGQKGVRRLPRKQHLSISRVIATARRKSPIVKVTMSSGRIIRCTPDHLWSSGSTDRGRLPWIRAKRGKLLRRFVTPTEPLPQDLQYKKHRLVERILGWCDAQLDEVVDVSEDGEGEVVSMQTSSGNYVAWGYASKNCMIGYDGCEGGGVGKLRFWDSQIVLLDVISKMEEDAYDALLRGEATDGIRLVDHKARQLGATMLSRSIIMHRLTLWKDQRAMTASVDEAKILEPYDRDKFIYDKLPFFLKPSLNPTDGGFDVKAQHIRFEGLNSRVLYQHSKQKSGMGAGLHFDLGHLTECSAWDYAHHDIELNFLPALSRYWQTFCILESTALGRGNWWHKFTERVRKGRVAGWKYVFVPWYAESKKYRRQPPIGWAPAQVSTEHASLVYDTSSEFLGKIITLSREQLYWYETERQSYLDSGTLNHFLTSYAATPEQSFQHSSRSAFSTELLEKLDLQTRIGIPYVLEQVAHG